MDGAEPVSPSGGDALLRDFSVAMSKLQLALQAQHAASAALGSAASAEERGGGAEHSTEEYYWRHNRRGGAGVPQWWLDKRILRIASLSQIG